MFFVELKQGRKRSEWTAVPSLADASTEARRFIVARDLTMHTFTGGAVCDDSEKVVARVSYNGKVWGPEPWHAGMMPVFDPFLVGVTA